MYRYYRLLEIPKKPELDIREIRAFLIKEVKHSYAHHQINRRGIHFSIPIFHFGVNQGAEGTIQVQNKGDHFSIRMEISNQLIPMLLFLFLFLFSILIWIQDSESELMVKVKQLEPLLIPFCMVGLLSWGLFKASSASRLGAIENALTERFHLDDEAN
ncbi:hypothetical protein [Croceimicrobium hydrocarbonivorans]|uniref:Uncharacterized protein n=1 Tax=Croceimicrobium hydrocarbonivorans TaxID=2761580 RepID=A0A7H0VHI1_9FLAO|nr:hypothetical protein [Croceimicrobium hydrocarbonivorans]QNR25179.1 hypothetical protein H4K34_04890 [Croceimicrobium hydrocarbonivorans]